MIRGEHAGGTSGGSLDDTLIGHNETGTERRDHTGRNHIASGLWRVLFARPIARVAPQVVWDRSLASATARPSRALLSAASICTRVCSK